MQGGQMPCRRHSTEGKVKAQGEEMCVYLEDGASRTS